MDCNVDRNPTLESRAHLFVMPMSRMLLSASTPSILVSSWLTMVSWVPVPSRTLPRCLQIASISSKMMMCSSCQGQGQSASGSQARPG